MASLFSTPSVRHAVAKKLSIDALKAAGRPIIRYCPIRIILTVYLKTFSTKKPGQPVPGLAAVSAKATNSERFIEKADSAPLSI